jgi:hypothetical protein
MHVSNAPNAVTLCGGAILASSELEAVCIYLLPVASGIFMPIFVRAHSESDSLPEELGGTFSPSQVPSTAMGFFEFWLAGPVLDS